MLDSSGAKMGLVYLLCLELGLRHHTAAPKTLVSYMPLAACTALSSCRSLQALGVAVLLAAVLPSSTSSLAALAALGAAENPQEG